MAKCRRCNSVPISVTGVTCGLCGEPLHYMTYYPHAGELKVQREGYRQSPRSSNVMQSDILAEIRKFCNKYSFPESVFGRRFFNDANLVIRLKNGAVPREGTITRIRAAMRDYAAG